MSKEKSNYVLWWTSLCLLCTSFSAFENATLIRFWETTHSWLSCAECVVNPSCSLSSKWAGLTFSWLLTAGRWTRVSQVGLNPMAFDHLVVKLGHYNFRAVGSCLQCLKVRKPCMVENSKTNTVKRHIRNKPPNHKPEDLKHDGF